jgi:C4-dicarboxylate-specific signal transduction histidine kinase
LTLAVLTFNAGVFWIVLEQGAVKRQSDLAWSLGSAIQAQLGAAVRSGADQSTLAEAVEAVGKSRLELERLVLLDPQLQPVTIVSGEPPGPNDDGVRAARFGKETHLEINGSVLDQRVVRVTLPIVGTGRVAAVLQLGMVLQTPEVPGGAFGFALMYVLACGLVIALFGWAQLRSSFVAPIQRLRLGTARIAEGDIGYQLDREETEELDALVASLNSMSAGLKSAQDALIRSERLAGVGRMAAGLAHEIGNPLAAVMAAVDVLQVEGAIKGEKRSDMLRNAREELDRIHQIIQALLGSARAGDDVPVAVRVDEAVAKAVATVRHQPDFQAIDIDARITPGLHTVWIAKDRLHQVLLNILRNASDAPKVTQIRLIVDGHTDGGITIRCEDNGTGFDPVALERAFEPFFTTKDVGKGTGLGLSTCMAMISQAGGTIEVSNLPEFGACVQIRLPSSPS